MRRAIIFVAIKTDIMVWIKPFHEHGVAVKKGCFSFVLVERYYLN
jgi:hypothetical protein